MRKWGIIGAVFFAVAVVAGHLFQFDAATVIEIAAAAFGFSAIVVSALSGAKSRQITVWKAVVVVVLASIGGVFCCIGGLSQNIFAEISGAALALLAVIFGMVFSEK